MKQTKEQFVGITYDELLAENAKLWELVHDMFGAYERAVCLLPDSYLKNVSKRGAMDFRERIQELESKAIK